MIINCSKVTLNFIIVISLIYHLPTLNVVYTILSLKVRIVSVKFGSGAQIWWTNYQMVKEWFKFGLLLVLRSGGPITNCSNIDFHFRITYLQSTIQIVDIYESYI